MEKYMKVYLRFSSASTFASWLVATYTGTWCSHVEFVVSKGQYLGSDIDTGVAFVDDQYYIDTKMKREEYFCVTVTQEQYDVIYQYARSQVGKDYDTWALIGNLFRRNWQQSKKWFCSELIAKSFKEAEYPLLNYRTNRITPLDLLKSPLLVKCSKEEAQNQE